MNIADMSKQAEAASWFLKAMANPQRLLILCTLMADELSVAEIEKATGIHQPTLSQQLAALRRAGVVATTKQGKQVYYRLADQDIVAVMSVLYDKFCAPKTKE